MDWKKLALTVGLILLVVVSGSFCKKLSPPATPGKPVGPDSTWQGSPTRFEVTTTAPGDKEVRYVTDWGDGKIDTTVASFESGAKAPIMHEWSTPGTYQVKVLAILNEDPTKASDWSAPASIRVLPNSAPAVPSLDAPLVAVKGFPTYFSAVTTDPDNDSVGYQFDWGDGKTSTWSDTLAGFLPGGFAWEDSHTYTKIETVQVKVRARDKHKTRSAWSAPKTVVIGTSGAVAWWWWTDKEDQYLATTSPVIVMDGTNELIYTTTDNGKIYGIDGTGRRKRSGSPVLPAEENEFSGHPAFSATRQHIIVGNEDGELYAFTTSLSKAWQWPGHTREDSLTYIEWGAAAVDGDKIYAPRDNDSLYYFTDLGSSVRFNAAYYLPGMVDAPVIDASGYVYIGTDSGYLYKFPPNLTAPTWRQLLQARDEVHSPAIGADGTMYCGTSSGRVFAVDPANGDIKWSVPLDGEAYRVVVSPSALFVGTGSGKLYSLNPANGATNWFKQFSASDITTSPILAGDYVYYQNSDDMVYCLQQSDGYQLWACDCPRYGPGKRTHRRDKLDFIDGQPAIMANGNVIIIGADAMYCVAGYPERPLMSAPWPKWQKNQHNTGKTGGW